MWIFGVIWKTMGWHAFATVDEPGSRLLTIQFLCTLKEIEGGVTFCLFRKEFNLLWSGLSTLLGFPESCRVDFRKATYAFEKNRFWEDISGTPICKKPRTNDIHNPTLSLMHKWIAMALFHRGDLRPVHDNELIIMYAMVQKVKVSHVQPMIKQWLESIKFSAPIECTYLITRIAKGIGVITNDQIAYISTPRVYIDESYLSARTYP
jgi:hypothetical protein